MTTRYHKIFEHKLRLDISDVDDFVSYLTKKVATIRKKHPSTTDIRISFDSDITSEYNDTYAEQSLTLLVHRDESDADVRTRLEAVEKREANQAARDLANFEALRIKLGKPE